MLENSKPDLHAEKIRWSRTRCAWIVRCLCEHAGYAIGAHGSTLSPVFHTRKDAEQHIAEAHAA